MQNESPEFWLVFERARDIRERLQNAEETAAMEAKGRIIADLKRETFDLLHEAGLPHPLKMLIIDLWGGPTFLDQPTAAMYVAAEIEGQHAEGALGLKKLSKLVHEKIGGSSESSGYYCYTTSMARWRKKPEYQELVSRYRNGARSEPTS